MLAEMEWMFSLNVPTRIAGATIATQTSGCAIRAVAATECSTSAPPIVATAVTYKLNVCERSAV